jgi:hypothetical protein
MSSDSSTKGVKRCQDAGAQGVVSWTLSAEALAKRIQMLVSGQNPVSDPFSANASFTTVESAGVLPGSLPVEDVDNSALADPFGVESDSEVEQPAATFEEKQALAQRLLAMALHNVRTSDLLRVASIEDVPRVVSEITRKVCGQDETPRQPSSTSTAPGQGDISSKLDEVFGFKKV